jgi:hypothetical protein
MWPALVGISIIMVPEAPGPAKRDDDLSVVAREHAGIISGINRRDRESSDSRRSSPLTLEDA